MSNPLTKDEVLQMIPKPFPPSGTIKGENKIMKRRMYPNPNPPDKPTEDEDEYVRLCRIHPPNDDLYFLLPVEEEKYLRYKVNPKYTITP